LSNKSGDTKLSSLALKGRVSVEESRRWGFAHLLLVKLLLLLLLLLLLSPQYCIEQGLQQLQHEVTGPLLAQLDKHDGAHTVR
jgi:hypothetical protein